ncbi:MAG: thioredoxin domain-containing protein [Flavobacteriales bacterium]|nr:thioredoxin domain-containing protein [Flavobacteriales bacterium]
MQRGQDIHGTNRLAKESSPYLLQHARNPVDWYPWGDEAFAKAREENKLVLVSIGYSSCHWCHVMERECFEDATIAQLMNDHYVCVKVDREERPDVDQVYMAAVQLITGQGGWPLNCFALPDGRPVYGGTYFPPPQWTRVLTDLHTTWKSDPDRVVKHAEQLRQGVVRSMLLEPADEAAAFERRTLDAMVHRWSLEFDTTHGGSDRVPKFPMPNNYEFLLRYAHLSGNKNVLHHVELTLDRMALGGICDQVGGGFARYSTDALWKVPHFEKMLYDNAQLVSLYSQAYQAFQKPLYKETVERTIAFIEREMTSPDGAFFSALDADSEEVEGLYYAWTRDQLRTALGEDLDLAVAYFDIDGQALWEHGRNILRRGMPDDEFAKAFGIGTDELAVRMDRIRKSLMKAREARIRPALDDKSLVSWNALMTKALCDAYEVLGEKRWLHAAQRNAELMLSKCKQPTGALRHSYKNGKASINGYLEDYCFFIEALIALYSITFEERWLNEAHALCEHAIRHFLDNATGLFHFTSDLDAALIARPMELADNVMPASNSSMAKGLFLLGTLLGEPRYLHMADRMLSSVVQRMEAHPGSHSNWAQLLLWRTHSFHEIAITGPEALKLREGFARHYIPNRFFLGSAARSSLPLLKDKSLPASTIFVCVDMNCRLPVPTVEEAIRELQ